MHRTLIITVLCFCFCGSMTFAEDTFLKAGNTAIATTTLDTNTTDSGPIGAIVNAINRLDDWIQKNLW